MTDFYETGWGQSFHFAPRGKQETFRESIIRHEHFLALKLNIKPDDVILDLGYVCIHKIHLKCHHVTSFHSVFFFNLSAVSDVFNIKSCGIGGPMRNISQFTGAKIVGVTINQYQVNRGNEINKKEGFSDKCSLQQGDFCNLEAFEDNTFDKIFAIESTCHAPNRCDVYDQVYRVLKPGKIIFIIVCIYALYALYTDKLI